MRKTQCRMACGDVLARLPWDQVDAKSWLGDWAPDATLARATRLSLGLELLSGHAPASGPAGVVEQALDRGRIVRAVSDLAPNPWLVGEWLACVEAGQRERGFADAAIAASSASLIEALRLAVAAERDRLAEAEFKALLDSGRIEFRLRADRHDFELPQEMSVSITGAAQPWARDSDGAAMQRSLFEPALRSADLNDFEHLVAGYLDEQTAVRWWHRNVARTQLGLQGWKRGKVYPDFVFALNAADGKTRLVLLETKGLHLKNEDSAYKQHLLERLTQAYHDERWHRVGSLQLEGGSAEAVVCDLVFDAAWRGTLAARHFSAPVPAENTS